MGVELGVGWGWVILLWGGGGLRVGRREVGLENEFVEWGGVGLVGGRSEGGMGYKGDRKG